MILKACLLLYMNRTRREMNIIIFFPCVTLISFAMLVAQYLFLLV